MAFCHGLLHAFNMITSVTLCSPIVLLAEDLVAPSMLDRDWISEDGSEPSGSWFIVFGMLVMLGISFPMDPTDAGGTPLTAIALRLTLAVFMGSTVRKKYRAAISSG